MRVGIRLSGERDHTPHQLKAEARIDAATISSALNPSSALSMTAWTGMRVPRTTHAPETFPGMRSTSGHKLGGTLSPFLS